MDRKKWIRDRILELDRKEEQLQKEKDAETAKKQNEIQANNDQADILNGFTAIFAPLLET